MHNANSMNSYDSAISADVSDGQCSTLFVGNVYKFPYTVTYLRSLAFCTYGNT